MLETDIQTSCCVKQLSSAMNSFCPSEPPCLPLKLSVLRTTKQIVSALVLEPNYIVFLGLLTSFCYRK